MPSDRSQAYQEFGVSILNHIVLEKILHLTSKEEVAYIVDSEEARRQVKENRYQLAFLLNHPQPEVVRAIANGGERVPGKSTYFYPKLPAGLVINPLD